MYAAGDNLERKYKGRGDPERRRTTECDHERLQALNTDMDADVLKATVLVATRNREVSTREGKVGIVDDGT